eukprot:CAMPEP_0115240818 /NCGR_PEP_ID=MMETSP0270-20121206/38109_1 /TAXON_ID=71861 /ORGANISM="Scrippsiella trochoidea, Strain CCMP3099" /LENGTH=336 /DNA_ID=CAMNT_0002655817 /DNA_START=59 /DNA_END=1069 /DNA_ORIENTATION=-
MEAHASCFAGFVAVAVPKSEGNTKQLSDHFLLGAELGRGAFGVVHSCTSKLTNVEYAVKQVPNKTSDLESIGREVTMLRELAHPTVAKLHGVYSSRCTVDLVFTIYRGGDLITGVELRYQSKRYISIATVQNLSWQMFRSINWLHLNNVVHRDVKLENFLLNVADIEREDCRVCLSDFGFAVALGPDERREGRCGTKHYVAPEMWAGSYGRKVDVWSAGICTYILLTYGFPFQSRKEVCNATLRVPSRCAAIAGTFLSQVLEKNDAHRLSASEVVAHPFLAVAEASGDEHSKASPQLGGDATPSMKHAAVSSEPTTAPSDSSTDDERPCARSLTSA